MQAKHKDQSIKKRRCVWVGCVLFKKIDNHSLRCAVWQFILSLSIMRYFQFISACCLAGVFGMTVPVTPTLAANTSTTNNTAIQNLDRVLVIVNNDVITQVELNHRFEQILSQLKKRNTTANPEDENLKRQVLERMIVERIQLQLADQTGIRIDDAQVDRVLERVASENQLTLPQFFKKLEKDQISAKVFRDQIRQEIILTRLREREVDSKIVISENEVENFLKTQEENLSQNEYLLGHLFVGIPEQASPEQIQAKRKKIETAVQALKSGQSLANVSATYSDAPEAMNGGMLDWKNENHLPPPFVSALKNMKKGELSAIIRSPNGFHVIQLVDSRNKNAPLLVEKTRARHILIRPTEVLSETEAKNKLIQIRDRLERGANFAELAKIHSNDEGSATKGGNLGWISPGDTVSDFEKAMNRLKINELSEPVRSQFGWHLIQVLERKKEDVSKERRQIFAKQAIRERKLDESYQEWIRQLRDQAYIEYHLTRDEK